MRSFFEINRPMTNEEAKAWLESYLGGSLVSLVSIGKCRTYARAIARTEKGEQEVKISLPMVLDRSIETGMESAA